MQVKTPLVEPIEGENNDIYGPSLVIWQNRNFVVYQDHTTWRGGNVKYVELDRELHPVGNKGQRYVLLDPPSEPPLKDRYRGGEFYLGNGKLYLYSSASRNPRIIVYATAVIGDAQPEEKKGKPNKNKRPARDEEQAVPGKSASLDEILKDVELETVYETTFEDPLRMVREGGGRHSGAGGLLRSTTARGGVTGNLT